MDSTDTERLIYCLGEINNTLKEIKDELECLNVDTAGMSESLDEIKETLSPSKVRFK